MPDRSFWPREHGAYAQLGFPLLTAAVSGRPTLAAGAFAIAAMSAFVAHEPAAVVLGVRGTRARREDGPRARRWLAALGGAALGFGALGFALAPAARPYAMASVALALLSVVVLYERKERTRPGEILAATAMAGAGAPVAAASGVPVFWILACWAVWSVQSAMTTLAVRTMIVRGRPWATLAFTAGSLTVAALAGRTVAVALAPVAAVCTFIVLASLTPKSLRAAGLVLAVAMLFTAASLAVGAHT